MTFWQFFGWYLIFGISTIIAYAIGEFIVMANCFGLETACAAVDYVNDNYILHAHTLIGKVANIAIGIILWPERLNECPEKSNLLFEACERIAIEKKFEKES